MEGNTMKLFKPEYVQYLYDLSVEFGSIEIDGSEFDTKLVIKGRERAFESDRVIITFDGGTIAEYPLTPTGVAQGLSMFKLALQKDRDELRQMVRAVNIKKFGERYYE
jgi:hypothetical protein